MIITLPIKAKSKARPRFGKSGQIYTPTEKYERELKLLMKQAIMERGFADTCPLDGYISVSITFTFENKKWRGDIDNFIKAVLDAGNGVLWSDDKNIVDVKAKILTERQDEIIIGWWKAEPPNADSEEWKEDERREFWNED